MTRSQIRLIRFLLIILMLLLAVFLVLSSDRLHSNPYTDGPVPTTEHLPQEDIPNAETPDGTLLSPTPSAPDTVSPMPTAKPAVLFDVTGSNPHSTLFQIVRTGSTITTDKTAYSNYHNAVKTLYLDNGTMNFMDDGFYSFTEADQTLHTYRVSDYVDFRELFSGLSSASDGSWFFLGALETKDYIYAAYDFWSVDELNLFFRMDKTGRDVTLVYATQYDELRNQGIFAASNEYIFYIYTTYDHETGATEASLLQAETDGSKSGILLPLSDGYSAHHLNLTDNALIFMVTDPQGATSLVRMDTLTHELTYIAEKCLADDYLYLFQNYAVVGTSGSSLVLYNLNSCEQILVPLGQAASQSLGVPVCNDTQLYLQYFRWNASSDTTLLRINPASATAENIVLVEDALCYVTGITEDFLYAETNGTYTRYPLP